MEYAQWFENLRKYILEKYNQDIKKENYRAVSQYECDLSIEEAADIWFHRTCLFCDLNDIEIIEDRNGRLVIPIVLKLLPKDAKMLRTWASVGRLMDVAMRACEKDCEDWKRDATYDDLESMKPCLMELCDQVRREFVKLGIKKAYDNGTD